MKRMSKRTWVLIGIVAVAAVTAVGGYAYWTANGTGQGSATVGTSADNLYVRGASATTLTPGGPSSVVSFTAKNFANFAQSISNIHLESVQACAVAWSTPTEVSYPVPAATCSSGALSSADCGTISEVPAANDPLGTDFYMADVPVDPDDVADGNLAASADRALVATGTIVMNNTSDNQNACKSKFLLLTFSTS